MKTQIVGPFNATITVMGAMHGVLIPRKYEDQEWFKSLLKVKKHKITIKIEEATDSD